MAGEKDAEEDRSERMRNPVWICTILGSRQTLLEATEVLSREKICNVERSRWQKIGQKRNQQQRSK